MLRKLIAFSIAVISISGCMGDGPKCVQTQDLSWANLSSSSQNITVTLDGDKYYGKFYYSDTKVFYLHPLINHITGNAKGVLISDNCNSLTCVVNLEKASKSGTGYCLENSNTKLLQISIVDSYAVINTTN